ncbi:hypothetical protein M9H77_28327 [Catharanthus roseus]|uniref:Uncharacterized protein n=1 Tax=Catharanthus roseus TaxID=4058 RepID=A0ACC0AHA4_CATRO|nr:hypothetical protein M9H77_28327 [Catharanthus roseus]
MEEEADLFVFRSSPLLGSSSSNNRVIVPGPHSMSLVESQEGLETKVCLRAELVGAPRICSLVWPLIWGVRLIWNRALVVQERGEVVVSFFPLRTTRFAGLSDCHPKTSSGKLPAECNRGQNLFLVKDLRNAEGTELNLELINYIKNTSKRLGVKKRKAKEIGDQCLCQALDPDSLSWKLIEDFVHQDK